MYESGASNSGYIVHFLISSPDYPLTCQRGIRWRLERDLNLHMVAHGRIVVPSKLGTVVLPSPKLHASSPGFGAVVNGFGRAKVWPQSDSNTGRAVDAGAAVVHKESYFRAR